MERDFMGLNSVKEEVSDGVSDSAAATAKVQGTQWALGHKVTVVPLFLSHISASNDTPNKAASSGQNLTGFIFKPSPSAASNTGQADSRNKSAGSPAQMTIFYNGSVKVYDSITPEKAQAIMFLAGNTSCIATSGASAGAQVRPPTPKFDAANVILPVSQCVNGQPSSIISSAISVSSHSGAQSMSSSTSTNELVINKSMLSPFSPDCKMEPMTKAMIAFGCAATPSVIPRGIPQFRKVSLARFLEKRRERVMNTAPYNAAKKPESTSSKI